MCKNGVKKISFSSYCKSKLWDHVLAIALEIYIYSNRLRVCQSHEVSKCVQKEKFFEIIDT